MAFADLLLRKSRFEFTNVTFAEVASAMVTFKKSKRDFCRSVICESHIILMQT